MGVREIQQDRPLPPGGRYIELPPSKPHKTVRSFCAENSLMMKTSVCITIKNSREEGLEDLLQALKKQTKKADEVVIIDGEKTKTTIAQGRNLAVKKARHEIIVMTDGGCIPHSDWLAKITKPFDDEAQVVAGFYRMTGESYPQKAFMPYVGVTPVSYNIKTFLPSARSIAFTKTVWKKVGSFRENLSGAGEDTAFAHDLLAKHIPIIRVKDALVDWEVPKTIIHFFIKIANYARGDVQTKIWRYQGLFKMSHNLKILSVFVRYLAFILLIGFSVIYRPILPMLGILCGLYIFFPIWKARRLSMPIQSRVLLPLVQIISDLAVMTGVVPGIDIGSLGSIRKSA